jgi:hypothetical protein
LAEQSIADLTKLGLFFGRISEVHIKNLKAFPFIFFNGVSKTSNMDYDIATKKDQDSTISYNLDMTEENDHLDKRYKAIETAVRDLFWKEMKVKISINGKEVYKSE